MVFWLDAGVLLSSWRAKAIQHLGAEIILVATLEVGAVLSSWLVRWAGFQLGAAYISGCGVEIILAGRLVSRVLVPLGLCRLVSGVLASGAAPVSSFVSDELASRVAQVGGLASG